MALRGLLVAAVIFATAFIMACGAGGNSTSKSSAALAPDILVATENGNFRLSDQRGNVVVLYFSFPG